MKGNMCLFDIKSITIQESLVQVETQIVFQLGGEDKEVLLERERK